MPPETFQPQRQHSLVQSGTTMLSLESLLLRRDKNLCVILQGACISSVCCGFPFFFGGRHVGVAVRRVNGKNWASLILSFILSICMEMKYQGNNRDIFVGV